MIERAPASTSWGQNFTLAFSGTASIDRVVLNKLADNTHCISMDHRQVGKPSQLPCRVRKGSVDL